MLSGILKVNMEPRDLLIAIRESGLTQAQISERTGIPQPTISKLERGDVQDVMSRNYRALQGLYDEISKEKSAA